MRYLKILISFFVLLFLQGEIFSHLTYLGVAPDLFLVSVIVLALLEKDLKQTIFYSAFAGFMQDLASAGGYLNVISKLVVGVLASEAGERYLGDEYSLAAGLVAVFTFFLCLLGFYKLAFGYGWIVVVIYNLLMVPIFWPLFKKIYGKD